MTNFMRIGCDLDGVIIDHNDNKNLLLKRRGIRIKKTSISDYGTKPILNEGEYLKFKNELYGPLSLRAREIHQAKNTIKKLISQGHEIRIISRRDRQNRKFALGWLKKNHYIKLFPVSHIHFVDLDEQKNSVCAEFEINLHIDDSADVIDNLTAPHYKVLFGSNLVNYSSATFIAKCWKDVLKYIKNI